jgi:nitroimidazol reductase NimA-like FMN-containing flavoprotein (pyridoxamine 5'-phosphate oxidase superfamily)
MEQVPNLITKEATFQFLKAHYIMALATVADGAPAVAPMVYLIAEDKYIFFVTFRQSFKAQNLLKNPHCSFTVWEFSKMSVQASGLAEEITDPTKIQWAMDTFADTATNDPNFWAPIFRIHKGDYIVFRITPTWMRALDLSHNTVRQEETPFSQIPI